MSEDEEGEKGAAAVAAADPEWVTQLKHGGAIQLTDPNSSSNAWSSPPGDLFLVRGPHYFTDRRKLPAGDCLLQPLAFDWIKSSSKIYEPLNLPNSRVSAALNKHPGSFVWAFNLQLPSKENYSAVFYFVSHKTFPENSLVDGFLKGDDSFRNSRLKLIANIVEGPWIVKTAVGEQAVCILGRALTCRYSTGDNFMQVDVDIGSSMIANAIVHLAIGYITSLTVDLAFLIESQQADELPEKILGAVRFANLELQSAVPVELMSAESSLQNECGTSSLGSRLWQGFTTFLKPVGTTNTPQQQEQSDDANSS